MYAARCAACHKIVPAFMGYAEPVQRGQHGRWLRQWRVWCPECLDRSQCADCLPGSPEFRGMVADQQAMREYRAVEFAQDFERPPGGQPSRRRQAPRLRIGK
jgi:hypothetical protein